MKRVNANGKCFVVDPFTELSFLHSHLSRLHWTDNTPIAGRETQYEHSKYTVLHTRNKPKKKKSSQQRLAEMYTSQNSSFSFDLDLLTNHMCNSPRVSIMYFQDIAASKESQ